jgi:hypothetical protein
MSAFLEHDCQQWVPETDTPVVSPYGDGREVSIVFRIAAGTRGGPEAEATVAYRFVGIRMAPAPTRAIHRRCSVRRAASLKLCCKWGAISTAGAATE